MFGSRIHKQKEYCLSVAQILTSRYQSRNCDGMQIERTSDMKNVLEEVALNHRSWLLLGLPVLSCLLGSTSSEVIDFHIWFPRLSDAIEAKHVRIPFAASRDQIHHRISMLL